MKKVLFVSPVIPYPLNNGGKIRLYHLLKALSEDCEIVFVALRRDEQTEDLELLKQDFPYVDFRIFKNPRTIKQARARWIWGSRHYRYYLNDFARSRPLVECMRELKQTKWDTLVCSFLESLMFCKLFSITASKTVLDQNNCEVSWAKSFSNSDSLFKKVYGLKNLASLSIHEGRCISDTLVVSVSRDDELATKVRFPWVEGAVIPNGCDLRKWRNIERVDGSGDVFRLLFCGSLDVEMNIDGLLRFCDEIYPHLLESHVEVSLTIIGRNPSPEIRRLDRLRNVTVVGEVSDVGPYYANADAALALGKCGGGSKLKLFEALASGVEVIAEDGSLFGIDDKLGQLIHTYRDWREIVDVIESIQLGRIRNLESARESQLAEYTWEAIGDRWKELILA